MNEELATVKLKIVQVGDPVLRMKARPLSAADILSDNFQQLIQQMKTTMRDVPGVGLAAPQIGLPLQVIVMEDRKEYWQGLSAEEIQKRDRKEVPFHVVINPKLMIVADTQYVEFIEGCLSVQGLVGMVPRATHVIVEYLNEKAESMTLRASGWYARMLQHVFPSLCWRATSRG